MEVLNDDSLFSQIVNISKAGAYDVVSKQVQELQAEIEEMKSVLNECYGYFSAPNFTDRYGTADRIKKVLKIK